MPPHEISLNATHSLFFLATPFLLGENCLVDLLTPALLTGRTCDAVAGADVEALAESPDMSDGFPMCLLSKCVQLLLKKGSID